VLSWLRKKNAASRHLGVDFYDDGFALAVIDNRGQRPCVTAARWYPLAAGSNRADVLAVAIREMGARGLRAVAVLPAASYSLVQLEKPSLPEDEIAEAMRWRIRDLVDFPVEQAVVDLIHPPPSHRPGAPPLMYVVVAKSADVADVAAGLEAAGVKVAAIDIVEMAIRNLSLYLDNPPRPRAYLHLQPGQTVIEIADGAQIYLSRRVQQDYTAGADRALLGAQMENLALEVQRSLDYFESQYALGPADRLSVMICDRELFDAFSDVARGFLTVPVERFDFGAIDVDEGVDLAGLDRGVTVLGAAMRGLPWAA
jgi:MSHA biogenesis protein MshI